MKIDSLICVLGWEDRFIKGMEIIFQNHDIKDLILISFEDYALMEGMEKNRDLLKELLITQNIIPKTIELNYSNSIENWKKLDMFFSSEKLGMEVLVNITTFPRETIWTLLFFLRKDLTHIHYIYFKPESYDETWLTKNHKSPRLLFKHSGIFDLNKQLVLFVITGFDNNRLETIVDYFEPDKVVIFYQEGNQFKNQSRNIGISGNGKFIDVERISLNNYDISKSTQVIGEFIKNFSDYNIILSSQGPKTSALSTYKTYLLANYKIALAYVPAKDFNLQYSIGINEVPVEGTFEF